MYSEMLLDHTSLHALRKRPIKDEELPVRAREVLQVVENLLFADTIWSCDTVTDETMSFTYLLHGEFLKHGLSSTRGDKLFRISHFPNDKILQACRDAAPLVFDALHELNAQDLRKLGGDSSYAVRPAGAQEMDYVNLANMQLHSEQASEYVHSSINDKGWYPSSSIPLLNADLFHWFKALTKDAGTNHDPAYIQFNTVCRWKFNEQLANQMRAHSAAVTYSPAYGRAIAINKIHSYSWRQRLESLELALKKHFVGEPQLYRDFSQYSPTSDVGLPLFGVWVIQSLKEGCGLGDLIEFIAKGRNDPRIKHIKKWLMEGASDNVEEICSEVAAEIKRCYPHGFEEEYKPKIYKSKLKVIFRLPWTPIQWELEDPSDLLGSTWQDKKNAIFRMLNQNTREATVLTGLIEEAFLQQKSHPVLEKIRSIIST